MTLVKGAYCGGNNHSCRSNCCLFRKDGVQKILGPTADYLGEELKAFTQRRINNIGKIFSNAEKKLGPRLDSPGQVPPKVLKSVINEGSYSEDPVMLEYFGGVLASSKTEIGRDDRGARLIKILDNLSTYQIRTHYLLYSTIAHLFSNSGRQFALPENRAKMEVFLPFEGYATSMEFTQAEWDNPQILAHIWHGLSSDDLIEGRWHYGNQEDLQAFVRGVPSAGIICQPSALGAELFLWAFGYGDKPLDYVLSGDLKAEIDDLPSQVLGVAGTKP